MERIMRSAIELFAVTVGACVAAAGTGCAAGGSPTEMTPPPPQHHSQQASKPELQTVTGFCAARAAAECSDAVIAACGFPGKSDCESTHAKSCMGATPQGTTYQPSKAPACLAVVTKAYATTQITATDLASLDPACSSELFAGPGAARAQCMTDYDCNSAKGLHCVTSNPPSGSNMGQCFVPQIITPGGDCSGQGTVCGTGTYCDPTGLTCVTDSQLNASCSLPDYPCAAGLQCNGVGPFATCAAGIADGSACNSSTECNSGLCDKATDQAGGTCASVITLSSIDSMCKSPP
jgi:hypothetical protein